VRSASSP